jgi:hypothetical protein
MSSSPLGQVNDKEYSRFLYFQLADLETRMLEAETRADRAEGKVSIGFVTKFFSPFSLLLHFLSLLFKLAMLSKISKIHDP